MSKELIRQVQHIDFDGVISESVTRVRVKTAPVTRFIKIFPVTFRKILGRVSPTATELYFWLVINRMRISESEIFLDSVTRDQYVSDMGMSRSSFYRLLRELYRAGLLTKVTESRFIVNPEYVQYGNIESNADEGSNYRRERRSRLSHTNRPVRDMLHEGVPEQGESGSAE